MARRAIWKGAVGFGMVAIPIKLYTATESKDISFVTMHGACHTRLRYKRYCPHHETEVEQSEIVRAYEYAKDEYVVMEETDFENLPVSSIRSIDIIKFVDLSKVDPINFDRTYMLEPEGVGIKPFYLLKQALESSKRAAIAKVSLRNKEHICTLRPYEHAIAMHTMHYPDEIRGTRELDLPEEQTAITEPEMAMAMMLIDQLSADYEPSEHEDQYRLALEKIIEGKLTSQEVVTAAPSVSKGKVTDLMEALRASIASAKVETPAATETNGKTKASSKKPRQTKAKVV